MSFFDDKQEILKVELTTYGRYLISRGKFKPAYYAFFDDDIIYDGECAGLTETQNSIQTRILDETLSLKPQTTHTSVQNSVKMNTLLSSEINKLKQEESQISADKNYALSQPLANSSVTSDYAPAWSFSLLNGNILNVEQFIDNADGNIEILQPYLKYPQINLKDSSYDIKLSKNNNEVVENYSTIYLYNTGSNEYYYSMKDQPIVLDLKELNVDDINKNFDIEVFIEEEIVVAGTDKTKTSLRQLNFKKDPIAILDGILLDEPITFEIQEDNTFVEYFFEMTIDDEIELPPEQKSSAGGLAYRTGLKTGPFGVDC